ncbi:MAG TPA: hypothetical protein VKQ30_20500 [Ktedonobacterales bacterium]|nr:hypothetical protein [Ktedonobacterales bacterium]
MDEFEIEITPLDAADDGDTSGPRWTSIEPARSPFAPHLTQRGKLMRGATAWGAVLLACVLIAVSSPAIRGSLGKLLHGAARTGQAATTPGAETIYFEHAVPWGNLSIDGRTIPPPTDTTTDSMIVAPGHHTLVYDAPPFVPLRCSFQVPITVQDNCPLEFAPPPQSVPSELYVRIVDLGATPDRLPASQIPALSSVIDTALGSLASQTYMPAGSTYLAENGRPASTAQPLVATLVFRLNTDANIVVPYLPGGFLCSQICYLGDTAGIPGGWGILALAHVTWNYALPQGYSVLLHAPASPVPDGSIALVTASVTWDGSWHAVAVPGQNQFGMSPICEIANDLLPTSPPGDTDPGTYTQRAEIPTPTAADGCLLTIELNYGRMQVHRALVLYRFGILVAANDDAHQLYPGLPVASSEDRALAEHIAAQSPA